MIATPINNAMWAFFTGKFNQETRKPRKEFCSRLPVLDSWLPDSSFLFWLRKFNRQVDRRDHAVGLRDSFAGDLECGAVIGTRARKWKTKCRVHAAVKGVQLERDEGLIVIHAKHGIEFTFDCAMENSVGGMRAAYAK